MTEAELDKLINAHERAYHRLIWVTREFILADGDEGKMPEMKLGVEEAERTRAAIINALRYHPDRVGHDEPVDRTILVDASGGNVTVNLPAIVGVLGFTVKVIKTDAGMRDMKGDV